MTRNPAAARTLTCQRSGRTFEYRGVGRPPKYHPEIAPVVRAEQRKRAARNRRRAA